MNKKIFFLLSITAIYVLIFLQYPIGLAIGRFAFNLDLFHQIEPYHLLLWGAVRVLVILPLIFFLLFSIDADAHSIYLHLGDRNRMLKFTFWGTFLFIILGIFLYPQFLNPSRLTINSFFYLLPFFSLFAITNAFVEEIYFRGSLLSIFTKQIPFWLSNLIQASLFAIIHFINPMSRNVLLFVLLTFLLGLVWGYITKITKSLLPAIILHILADIFVAVSLF